MKFWISLVLVVTFLMVLSLSNKETLGERISGNIVKLHQQRVAYADSSLAEQEIGAASVLNHINYLRHTAAMHCDSGLRMLDASARYYADAPFNPQVNTQLSKRIDELCL